MLSLRGYNAELLYISSQMLFGLVEEHNGVRWSSKMGCEEDRSVLISRCSIRDKMMNPLQIECSLNVLE